MDGTDLMGIFSIVLTLSIPLLAIVFGIGKKIKKDKVSALIYGLYYCKLQEDARSKKKKRDIESKKEKKSGKTRK